MLDVCTIPFLYWAERTRTVSLSFACPTLIAILIRWIEVSNIWSALFFLENNPRTYANSTRSPLHRHRSIWSAISPIHDCACGADSEYRRVVAGAPKEFDVREGLRYCLLKFLGSSLLWPTRIVILRVRFPFDRKSSDIFMRNKIWIQVHPLVDDDKPNLPIGKSSFLVSTLPSYIH